VASEMCVLEAMKLVMTARWRSNGKGVIVSKWCQFNVVCKDDVECISRPTKS